MAHQVMFFMGAVLRGCFCILRVSDESEVMEVNEA